MSFPGSANSRQWEQAVCSTLYDKQAAQVDDDDQSTTVPSDSGLTSGTVSDFSTWDTGNLEELASCGVLTSAEVRTARLQRMARVNGVRAAPAQAKANSGRPVAKAKSSPVQASGETSAGLRAARAKQLPKAKTEPLQLARSQGYATAGQVDDDDQSTAAPSDIVDSSVDLENAGAYSSAELRDARCQLQQATKPKPAASERVPAKSVSNMQVTPKAKATPKTIPYMAKEHVGSQLQSELNKSSREAIRDMGLWEYMPARNPVVTRDTVKGADWHVGFDEYQHSLGGVPDVRPAELPPKCDALMRNLDVQSREAIKEMGLWEHMPARNPVVTHQTVKGAAWHVGFEEYEHSLGGVPDSKPVERPHKAAELHMQLDVHSRKKIKELGLWEHMPARNPVVTKQSNKGAGWHVGFGQYVHTLGGVPDS